MGKLAVPFQLTSILSVMALLWSLTAIGDEGDEPFVGYLSLPDGRVVVVAESALEPRSIGSYSLRLYSGANPDFPFDDFLIGAVFPREGSISALSLADIDQDEQVEVIVVCRSAGSGSYLSARAFSLRSDVITVVAKVEGLSPGQDPITEIMEETWRH
jgi:hypothetical protein